MYKRYIRKIIISFILLFAMLINSIYPLYNDGETSDEVQAADAKAETLNVANLWREKRDSLGWTDASNVPTKKMWYDTSSIPVMWIDTEKEGEVEVGPAESDTSYGTRITFEGDIEDHTVTKEVSGSAIMVSDMEYSGMTCKYANDEYENIPTTNGQLETWEGWNEGSRYDPNNNDGNTIKWKKVALLSK